MKLLNNNETEKQNVWLPRVGSCLVIFLSLCMLSVWIFNLSFFIHILPQWPLTRPLAGLSFLLLGLACLLFQGEKSKLSVAIIRLISIFVAVCCILSFSRYFINFNFSIEDFLFSWVSNIESHQSTQLAMLTSLGFIIISISTFFLSMGYRKITKFFMLIALVVPFFILMSYLYGIAGGYNTSSYGQVPCSTAVLFILLIGSFLFLHPEEGAVSLLISKGPGGVLARRLVPIIIILPVLLGFLRVVGQETGVLSFGIGVILSVLASMMIMLAIFWITGRRLDSLDKKRQEVEKETQKQSRFTQALADNAGAFVYVKDKEERFILINDSMVKHFNIPREGFIGKTCHDIFPKEYADSYREHENQVKATRSALIFEEIAPAGGKNYVYVSNKFPLFDENGEIYGVGGISTEITQMKNIEEELRCTKMQAEKLADEAFAASRAKSAFLATMSHEIRTPLNGIIGMADLLLDSELPKDQREFISTIQLSGWSLLEVINEILDFSKIEAGHLEIEKIDFNLRNLIEDVVEILATQAHRKDLALGALIEVNVPDWVNADPTHLRHVLTNLIGNAIKFTTVGEICLKVSVVENDVVQQEENSPLQIRFDVTDTGIGMSPEVQASLFKPFSQGDSSISRKYGGTGLGLAIAKKLTEVMGGKITCESEIGVGSHFWFILPVGKATTAEQSSENEMIPALQGLRVLMVDDNQVNRRIVQAQTMAWKMRCDTVDNGYDALVKCRTAIQEKDPYALVFIDYVMPGIDGIDLARRIHAFPELEKTPLLMLTSLGKPVPSQQLEAVGIKVCLTKPVRQSKFHEGILLALTKHPSQLLKGNIVKQTMNAQPIQPQAARVLLVEDYPTNQQVAVRLLTKLGYQADIVENGLEAIEAFSKKTHDVILMDCQMPEMDGYTASRKIRELEQATGKHIPIIAMTAHALKGDKEKCLAAGMDDYISKPINLKELKEVLARTLHTESVVMQEPVTKNKVSTISSNMCETVIDRERLDLLFGDDTVLLRDFFKTFINSTHLALKEIKIALDESDGTKARALAHGLKGSCGNSGAIEMAALAKRLEECVALKDWNTAKKLYEELRIAFTRVIECSNF